MGARVRDLWKWFILRFGLPFMLPALVAVAMVWGLHDVLVQSSPHPDDVPDWFALFSSTKVLLVGLLIGIGAMRDMWIVREAVPIHSLHSWMILFIGVVWSYALLQFAVV
jgi:hypothetical protein